jgi:hypothetical protein
MQNNSHKTEDVKPLTLQLQLDTRHFRAQLSEMALIARQEFFRKAVEAVALAPAEVREAEGTTSRLSEREVVQVAMDWVKRADFGLSVGCYPLPPADHLIAALSSLAKAG